MTSYIFQQIAKKGYAEGIDDTIRQRDTRTWFRDTASKVKTVNRVKMMNDPDNIKGRINVNDLGRMFMFYYDPKHAKTLPYYDTFPLIFPVDFNTTGFYGINLHYLPPFLRAKLMDAIYSTVSNRKYDDTTKLKISYRILASTAKFKYFRPCFKQYLWSHVRSGFLNIEPRMWDAALMLPSERFKKANKARVWKESEQEVK